MALKNSTSDSLLEQLEDDGFVLLGRVLSEEETAAARERLQSHLAHTIASLGGDTQEHERRGIFARIHTRQNRHDLCLKMTAENSTLLRKAVSAKAEVYRGALGNDAAKARLVEFGAITSHPGATQQTIHSDVEFCPEARKVFTTFVALQDITEDMGPTLLWPGTNSPYWCEFYKPRMLGPVDPYYVENTPTKALLKAGEAILLDTRTMHAGGANESDVDRTLFHFSFETTQGTAPVGFTYNLHKEVEEKQVTFADLSV